MDAIFLEATSTLLDVDSVFFEVEDFFLEAASHENNNAKNINSVTNVFIESE